LLVSAAAAAAAGVKTAGRSSKGWNEGGRLMPDRFAAADTARIGWITRHVTGTISLGGRVDGRPLGYMLISADGSVQSERMEVLP
jgi:hypothetical protein